ncbi:complement C2-like, partial [Rhinoraja longicauda]
IAWIVQRAEWPPCCVPRSPTYALRRCRRGEPRSASGHLRPGHSHHWRRCDQVHGQQCVECGDVHLSGRLLPLARSSPPCACRNGRWSHTHRNYPPICKAFRCPPPVLEEGFFSPVNTSYAIGDVITLECYEGYFLKGSHSRRCKINGRWNGTNTVCSSDTQDCPHPGIPAGGSKSGTNYNIGYKVRYSCNDGLVLLGSSTRECERLGEWSGRMPTCQHKSSFDTPEDVAEAFTASFSSNLGLMHTDSIKTPESLERKIYLRKDVNLHIYFLIDASNSVGQVSFEHAINVVKNLIEKIISIDVNLLFGVITYASFPEVVVDINDPENESMENVMDALYSDKAKYGAHEDRRGTNIYGALEKVLEMMSLTKVRLRNEQEKWLKIRFVTIIFTDGKANMGGEPKMAVARIQTFVNPAGNRSDYLDMYAFGITEGVELSELDSLASKKTHETHTFLVRKVDDLVKAFDKILDLSTIGDLCGVGDEVPNAEFRKKYPWHVKINGPGIGTCSGSIVAPTWVLTAAHCFVHFHDMSTISVTVGGQSRQLPVKDLVLHPAFNIAAKVDQNITQFYDYDVALLELSEKITFDETIRI